MLSLQIRLQNGFKPELFKSLPSKSHLKANFHSGFHQSVSIVNMIHQQIWGQTLLNEATVLEKVKRVSITIKWINLSDQKFEYNFHLQLVFNDDIKISTLKLNCQALPGIKGHQFIYWFLTTCLCHYFVDRIPKHPEPCGVCSI